MAQPAPIEQFGKYQILERVARGGMAEIFKARMEGIGGFNRLFAIKRVLPTLSSNREYIDLLVDEAKVAGLLSHANIVQILDLGSVKGQYYVAMEFVHGRDLGRTLERCRERGITLPVPHAVFILIEVLKGLEYAHNRQILRGSTPVPLNIVHRDVSPSNVLLSFQGEVKLTDFGIAKASVKALETVSGVIKGKFDYMSPEQASAQDVDQRTDLFAAGVLLYEMLCGGHPFRKGGDLKTIAAIRSGEYQPPTFTNPDVPYSLEVILDRALAHEPSERFQSATEFKEALNKFFHDAGFIFSHTTLAAYLKGLFPQAAAPRTRKKKAKVLALKDQETRPIAIPQDRRPKPVPALEVVPDPAPEPVDELLLEDEERPTVPEEAPPIMDAPRPTVPDDDPIQDHPSVAFGPIDSGSHAFERQGDTSTMTAGRQPGRTPQLGPVVSVEVELEEDSEDLATNPGVRDGSAPGDNESTLIRDPEVLLQASAPPNEWAEDIETVIRADPTKLGSEEIPELELDELTAARADAAPAMREQRREIPPEAAPTEGTEPGPTALAAQAPPPRERPSLERPSPAPRITRRTWIFVLIAAMVAGIFGFGLGVLAGAFAMHSRAGGLTEQPVVTFEIEEGVTLEIDGESVEGGSTLPITPGPHTVDVNAAERVED